jgi:hypothetical protein
MSTIAVLVALGTYVAGCFTPKTYAKLKAKLVEWANG